jgi:hypothetical protein
MSKMDACFQQFFYADSAHSFPLVKTPDFAGASRRTRDYGLMFLWPLRIHTNTDLKAVVLFHLNSGRKKDWQHNKEMPSDNLYFAVSLLTEPPRDKNAAGN